MASASWCVPCVGMNPFFFDRGNTRLPSTSAAVRSTVGCLAEVDPLRGDSSAALTRVAMTMSASTREAAKLRCNLPTISSPLAAGSACLVFHLPSNLLSGNWARLLRFRQRILRTTCNPGVISRPGVPDLCRAAQRPTETPMKRKARRGSRAASQRASPRILAKTFVKPIVLFRRRKVSASVYFARTFSIRSSCSAAARIFSPRGRSIFSLS